MEEEKGALYAPDDGIDLYELLLALRKRHKLIAIVPLVSVAAAAAASFLMPPVYRVSAFLVPDGSASRTRIWSRETGTQGFWT